jgi:hypothetical protein
MYSAFDDWRSEQEARAIAEVVSKSDSVSVLIDTARSVSYSRAA